MTSPRLGEYRRALAPHLDCLLEARRGAWDHHRMLRKLARRSTATALQDALQNRSIRHIEIAWAIGTAADWAFLVILLVVAYDAGGAFAVGAIGAIRVAPAMVAPLFATPLVARFRGDRVLTAINLARGLGALLTAIVIASGM